MKCSYCGSDNLDEACASMEEVSRYEYMETICRYAMAQRAAADAEHERNRAIIWRVYREIFVFVVASAIFFGGLFIAARLSGDPIF
jgi:hypothetical protein